MAKKKTRQAPPSEDAPKNNPFASLLGATPAAAPAPRQEPPGTGGGAPTPSEAPAAKRFPDKLVVRREKKGRGGKTVTRISGIPADLLPELQKTMKKALGCGATVEGDDLLLLGALVDRAAAYLEGQGARRVVRAN